MFWSENSCNYCFNGFLAGRSDDIGIIGCDFQVIPSLIIEDELQRIIDYYYQRTEENASLHNLSVLRYFAFPDNTKNVLFGSIKGTLKDIDYRRR